MAVDTRVFELQIRVNNQTATPIAAIQKNTLSLSTSFNDLSKAIIVANQALSLFSRAISMVGAAYREFFQHSVELEYGIAKISTLFTDGSLKARDLANNLLYLQLNFGITQKDAIDAYYEAIASGAVKAKDAMFFLNDAVKLAIGGTTSLETAVYGLTGIISAYGLNLKEVADLNDSLFIGAAEGKTTIEELARSLGSAAAMARSTGTSYKEYIAAVSAISSGGVLTREAVTQVESALTSLSRQSTELELVLYDLGITSIQAEIRANGFVNTLRKLTQYTGKSVESMMDLFGRIEGVNGIMSLTSDVIGVKFDDMLKQMTSSADSASKALEKSSEVVETSWSDTVEKMNNTIKMTTGEIPRSSEEILSKLKDGTDKIMSEMDKMSSEATNIADNMSKNIGDRTETAFKKMTNTVDFRIKQLKARLDNLWVTFDIKSRLDPFITAMNKVVDVLSMFAQMNFERLGKDLLILAESIWIVNTALTAFAAAKAFGMLASVADFAAGITLLGQAFGAAAIAGAKFIAISAAFVAMAFAIGLIIKNFGNLTPLFKSAQEAMKVFLDYLEMGLLKIMKILAEFWVNFLESIQNGINRLIKLMPGGSKLFGEVGQFSWVEDAKKQIEVITKAIDENKVQVGFDTEALKKDIEKVDWWIGKDIWDFFNKNPLSITVKPKEPEETKKRPDLINDPQFRMPTLFTAENLKLIKEAMGSGVGSAASMFSKALSPFFMGWLGALEMILDVFQKLIDIIPTIIDKVSNIFKTLTDLPGRIIVSVKNLHAQFLYFIENFIPNVVDSLLEGTDLAEKLPEQVIAALEKLMQKMPQILEKLIRVIIRVFTTDIFRIFFGAIAIVFRMWPKFQAMFVESFVKSVPLMGKAISEEFKKLANDIARYFGMKELFHIDTDKIGGDLKKIGDDIARSASDIFSVTELKAAGKGMGLDDKIKQALGQGGDRLSDILAHWWRQLVKAWRELYDLMVKAWAYLWDKVLSPFINALIDAWREIYNTILKPVIDALKIMWRWVWDKILGPFINGLRDVWIWLYDNLIKPWFEGLKKDIAAIIKILSDLWNYVNEKIFQPIIKGFSDIFNWFNDKVVTPLLDGVKAFIADVSAFIKGFFDTMTSLIITPLQNLFNWFNANVVTPIVNAFKDFAYVVGIFLAAWNEVVKFLSKFFSDFFTNLGDKIKSQLDLTKWIDEVGKKLSEMLSSGWSGALKSLGDYVTKELPEAIKGAFASTISWFKDGEFKKVAESAFTGILTGFRNLKIPVPDWKFPTSVSFDFSWPKISAPEWLQSFIDAVSRLSSLKLSSGGFVSQVNGGTFKSTAKTFAESDAGKVLLPGASYFTAHMSKGGQVKNGILYAAGGSLALGTDTVPAMLTPGEFVVNREAASKNLGLLSFMNKVKAPLSPVVATATYDITINTTSALTPEQIKREVMPVLERELKRKSLDGKFVLSTTGLR